MIKYDYKMILISNFIIRKLFIYFIFIFLISLVTERLPRHPDVEDNEFRNEYEFNKKKASMMTPELENLMKSIIATEGSNDRELPLPPVKKGPPPIPSHLQQSQQPQQPQQQSSWSFGSLFGKKKEENPPQLPPRQSNPPLVPQRDSNGPPLPPRRDVVPQGKYIIHNEDVSDLSLDERIAYKAIGTMAYNDKVQNEIGNTVARVALNEGIQNKVAEGVKNMALNEQYQESIGSTIAENTDNEILKKVATNKTIQKAVGVSIAKTVGNKELQQKAGMAVAKAATNKKVQEAAAKGFMGALKVGIKGAKLGGKTALTAGKLYIEHKMSDDKNQGGDDDDDDDDE